MLAKRKQKDRKRSDDYDNVLDSFTMSCHRYHFEISQRERERQSDERSKTKKKGNKVIVPDVNEVVASGQWLSFNR